MKGVGYMKNISNFDSYSELGRFDCVLTSIDPSLDTGVFNRLMMRPVSPGNAECSNKATERKTAAHPAETGNLNRDVL